MIADEMRELLRTGSAIRKIWTQGLRLKEIHGSSAVADMTLGNPLAPPPAALLDALEEIVAAPPEDLHRYTPNAGHPAVRERIADHLGTRGVLPGARADHVVVTAGASAATNVALRAVVNPGDEVILFAPYFPDYPAHVLNHRAKVVVVSTTEDFLPDPEPLEQALSRNTRAVLINHPNNPSGRQYPESVLRQLADLLRRQSAKNGRPVYLISDEPYRELRFTADPFTSPARVYEHGLIAYSFSKSHSIPGERIGYLAVNPDHPGATELVDALSLANRILGFTNAPSLWQQVIARCLDARVDLRALRGYRDRLLEALHERGYDVVTPDGAFYLFPRTPGDDDDAFVQCLMEKLLLVVPGATFGMQGHFRMAFCVDQRTVDLALQRLPHL